MRILWFSLQTESGRSFHLNFPISLNVFLELLDSVHDLMALLYVFVPKRPPSDLGISIHTVKELIRMLGILLGSITEDGPYDLVDVAADNVKVSMKIR